MADFISASKRSVVGWVVGVIAVGLLLLIIILGSGTATPPGPQGAPEAVPQPEATPGTAPAPAD